MVMTVSKAANNLMENGMYQLDSVLELFNTPQPHSYQITPSGTAKN
jgi:hypothetical protein